MRTSRESQKKELQLLDKLVARIGEKGCEDRLVSLYRHASSAKVHVTVMLIVFQIGVAVHDYKQHRMVLATFVQSCNYWTARRRRLSRNVM